MRKNTDLTQGKPLVQIFLFSLPVLFGSVFQQLYSTVDTAVVGRYAGTAQLAAVGSTGSLSFFILGFVFGLTGGFSILASQARGAKDEQRLRKVIGNTVILSAIIVAIFTPLALLLARPMLTWMGTPADIIDDAVLYISIVFGGYAFTMLYNIMSSLLRAIGDSRTPLYFLILSCLLNVGMDILFVVQFQMGVAGVALATLIAQTISGVLCLIYAWRKYDCFRLKRADLRPDGKLLRRMLALGIPMALQSSLTAAGMLLMQSAINGFGSSYVAGFAASNRVESLLSMVFMAIGVTMATYAGQNVGAQKYDRLFRGVRAATVLIVVYAVLAAVVCLGFGQHLLKIFVDTSAAESADMLDAGMTYLRTLGYFIVLQGVLQVFRSTLQGIGRSIYTLVGGAMECVLRVVVSLTLPPMIGFVGCCLATPAAWISAAIPLVIAYFYEKRKLMQRIKAGAL